MQPLPAETIARAETGVRSDPERLRVLVIDDMPLARKLLAHLLTQAGFQVTQAAGGADGIRQLREAPVDLVLTDLRMPDCSGWEVARAARQFCPGLPVILVTGSPEAEEAAPDLRALVSAIIPKPIHVDILLRAVNALVSLSCAEEQER